MNAREHFYWIITYSTGLHCFTNLYAFPELVKNITRHPSGKRTPRVPVIFPADMNVAHAGIQETENAINCTKKASGATNNELECSSHGSPGISESAKFVQGQTFLEAKGTGSLKKRRIEQSMEQGQTIKDEHETAMVAKEGNDLTKYQRLTNLFSPGTLRHFSPSLMSNSLFH